ncbi:DUF1684 domain-containing protein, partial [Actinotalea sp. C106]|uniref:DUF1684 domain-containing protein n=1 Tax=Actinotalea sp. C106 TaxID=2908644 RepID=UPI0020286A12
VSARAALLLEHPASPVPIEARGSWAGPVVAEYDPALRFVVPVDREVEPARREVPTGTDGVVGMDRVGRVELGELGGLDLWWLSGYGGGLFLPVKDPAEGSYGGGRYLLDTIKGADLGGGAGGGDGPSHGGFERAGAELVVDLNFAYQPSCAYDPAWACPLAGPGNTLAAGVEVGERYVTV